MPASWNNSSSSARWRRRRRPPRRRAARQPQWPCHCPSRSYPEPQHPPLCRGPASALWRQVTCCCCACMASAGQRQGGAQPPSMQAAHRPLASTAGHGPSTIRGSSLWPSWPLVCSLQGPQLRAELAAELAYGTRAVVVNYEGEHFRFRAFHSVSPEPRIPSCRSCSCLCTSPPALARCHGAHPCLLRWQCRAPWSCMLCFHSGRAMWAPRRSMAAG